jgi:hypothetical protein
MRSGFQGVRQPVSDRSRPKESQAAGYLAVAGPELYLAIAGPELDAGG